MKNKSDEQLVLEYIKGDENAFNEIYARYKGLVKFYCRNFYLLGAETEDLIQEGMFGLIKAVNGYKSGESLFKTYASHCIKTSIFSAVKKYSGFKSLPLNSSMELSNLDDLGFFSLAPEDVILNKELDGEIKNKFFANLTENELIVLKEYLNGLTYLEIASKIGETTKFVDNALTRAKKKIIKQLQEEN